MDERAHASQPHGEPEQQPAQQHPEPLDLGAYELIELRERLDSGIKGYQLAREAIDDRLAQQRPLLEAVMETATTAKHTDYATRRNVQAAEEITETAFRIARRVREELTAPPPPPRPGTLEILVGSAERLLGQVFEGQGGDIIDLVLDKLASRGQKELGAGAPAAPAQSPSRAEEPAPRAPAAPEGPLPELGVLFPEVPPELQGLTLEEMRAALYRAAQQKRGG